MSACLFLNKEAVIAVMRLAVGMAFSDNMRAKFHNTYNATRFPMLQTLGKHLGWNDKASVNGWSADFEHHLSGDVV
jgi:hypothetical protein